MSLLQVKNLKTYYYLNKTVVKAVDDITFSLDRGEALGLAGESGCGKSTAISSILRLVQPPGKIVSGEILYGDKNILNIDEEEFRKNVRWKGISVVPQNAMSSLNAVIRVGSQIVEAIRLHERGVNSSEALERVWELFQLVGMDRSTAAKYPHELSGGMKQRVILAMALACNPKILIADEPATALDVIVKANLIELIRRLQKELSLSIIMVSHDLSVIAQSCNRCAIMYAGRIVEVADVFTLFSKPRNPYTIGLMRSFPNIRAEKMPFVGIPGRPPDLGRPPPGCRFHPRCRYAGEICVKSEPELAEIGDHHLVACFKVGEIG